MDWRIIKSRTELGFNYCFKSLKQPQHKQQKMLFNTVYCNTMVHRSPLYPVDLLCFSDLVRDQTEILYYLFSPSSFYICDSLIMIQDLLGFYGDKDHIQYLDSDFFKSETKYNSRRALCSSSIILGQSHKRGSF